ncbi:MAG: esterase-like activity of phytase family protein [Paracoccaceae bacterium]
MFTLQILHASDLEGGVDAIGNAPNFASIVAALETQAEADGVSSILLSAGDNYIPGPFYNAAGDAATFNPIFEGLYNQIFGLIEAELISPLADTNQDFFFDNDEIEAFINNPELNTNGFTFEDIYTTDINGDGAPDYFEEIDNFEGRVDISIMNLLGFDASAVGNHEFDAGTASFNDIVIYDSEEGNSLSSGRYGTVNYLQEVDWLGAQFPYLSANLDFSEDDEIGALFTDEILPSTAFESDFLSARDNPADPTERGSDGRDAKVAPATIVEVDGEQVGVVGATTQLVAQISSTGNINDVSSPGTNDMAALAAVLQPVIDDLTAQGVDKIVLTSHLQQFALEQELATLLRGVDVIIAGGSDTLLADEDDLLRPGDEAEQPYPFLTTDADGNPVAIVSTDGEYSYVGRLVVEFDENGVIVPESIDPAVSGAFGTDDANTVTVIESVLGTPLLNAEPLPLEEAQEVPALEDGPATGEIVFVQYFDDTNQLTVVGGFGGLSSPLQDVDTDPTALDVDGIPIDAIHLHQGAAGENGPVIRSAVSFPGEALGDPAETGFDGGFQVLTRLTDEEEAALFAGELYINIHTEANPGGELRGQIPADALVEGAVEPADGAAIGTTTTFDGVPVGFTASLVDAVSGVVTALDSNIFGETEVFIEGRREDVRTEETTLGNLTADANIVAAQTIDPTVTVSIKNGGGIRAAIGETDMDGNLLPTQANPVSGKEEGEISELDIQNSLRFNNGLVIVDLSTEDLKIVLEHSVASSAPGATPGQFFQVGGLRVSVDLSGTAQVLDDDGNVTTPGSRIQTVALVDETGQTTQVIIEDGEVLDGAPTSIRTVTLDFLAGDEGDLVGGDGYPFRALSPTVIDTGIGEQAALQDFLAENFSSENGTPFDAPELAPALDSRIQFVDQRSDTVAPPAARAALTVTQILSFQGESEDPEDPEGASEVVSFGEGRLFVTNGSLSRIDVFGIAEGVQVGSVDLSFVPGFDGVQSVAVKDGIGVAVAGVELDGNGIPQNGVAVVFDAVTLEVIDTVATGVLPDAVIASPQSGIFLIANEGEFNSEARDEDGVAEDAPGGVTLVDVSDLANITAETVTFEDSADLIASAAFNGVRFNPDADPVNDLEPEYIAFTPDGSTAYVSMQEANAFAVFDVASRSFTDILSQGVVDHSAGRPEITLVDFDDLPPLGTDGTGLEIDLGGFSGLWFDGINTDNGNLQFLAVPDRGPNGGEVVDGARTFNLPDYQARVVNIEVNEATGVASITGETFFTAFDGETPITGLPNIEGFDEIPVDALGNTLPYDPLGADMEGIVRAPDGSLWTVDEYRPAIYQFSSEGVLLNRFVPEGTSLLGDNPEEPGFFGEETLPEEYANRRTNRGFEAVALDAEAGVLYAFIQTPLANPDRDASDASQAIRILGIDVTNGQPVEEYVLLLEDPESNIRAGGRVDKMGDAVFLGDGKFAVIERDANVGPIADKPVFEIDISNATNLLTAGIEFDGTLEQQSAAELIEAGVVPVDKRKVLDLPEEGYFPSDKPEGLALLPDGRLAVLNDNDFGIEDATGRVPQIGLISFDGEHGIDATDDDVIDIVPRNVFGMRMADAIVAAEISGRTYLFGANEGDGRGDAFDGDGNPIANGDEARVSELVELGLLDEETFFSLFEAEALPLEESQEVGTTPPDTDATGSFDVSFDAASGDITVSGSFDALSGPLFPVGGIDRFGNPESPIHVHIGAAGANGPIVFNTAVDAAADGLSGTFTGSATLTDDEIAAALEDGLYVNLHTEAFNGGELRGQIDLPEEGAFRDPDLNRLIVSTIDGDTDGDGDIDQLFTYGSRSFTIFDTAGNVVFDSGNEFESIIANIAPERFNDDDGELGQNRSDAKGPEPEAIEVIAIGEQTYAFIGLERDSGVMVYNVTRPEDSRFVTYIDGFDLGELGPEIIEAIPAAESPTGTDLIAISYEISGTTAVFELGRLESDLATEDFYRIFLSRQVDITGYDFWSDIVEQGDLLEFVANAFDESEEFAAVTFGQSTDETIDFMVQNGLDRAATADEIAFYTPLVEEDGFDVLALDIVGGTLV